MSFAEFIIVAIVCFFIIKPEDLPKIMKKFRELRKFSNKLQQEIIEYLDPDIKKTQTLEDDLEQINFYLQKITALGADYEGEYAISAIKAKYNEIVQEQIKLTVNNKNQENI